MTSDLKLQTFGIFKRQGLGGIPGFHSVAALLVGLGATVLKRKIAKNNLFYNIILILEEERARLEKDRSAKEKEVSS